jgi:DNA-binding NtrC family response regulator
MASVLLIDDDRDLLRWASSILAKRGHKVHGESSARFLKSRGSRGPEFPSPEIAIIDMLMPEVDGIEAVQIMRRQYPAVKIIAISGGGHFDDGHFYLRLAEQFGVVATILKPTSAQMLCRAVDVVAALSAPAAGQLKGKCLTFPGIRGKRYMPRATTLLH